MIMPEQDNREQIVATEPTTETGEAEADTRITGSIDEIADLTTQSIKDGKQERAEAKPDLGFIRDLYPDDPEVAKRLLGNVEASLCYLEGRKRILVQARQVEMKRLIGEQACMHAQIYLSPMVLPPSKALVSRVTAPAITQFMQLIQHSPEIDVRTALALSQEMTESGKPSIHWVTIISFKKTNRTGGKDMIKGDDAMLFIDASAKMPGHIEDFVVDKVSNMADHGLTLFDHTRKEHTADFSMLNAAVEIAGKSNLPLDKYSHGIFRALIARGDIREFINYPDLFAETLMESLKQGNILSEDVRQELLAILGKAGPR